ncbi:DoxX family protein [Staphylococcus chromogenes]|nr:DoxX family protein [Staphylococcus chromogenes]
MNSSPYRPNDLPDRAQNDDLDGLADVPTYTQGSTNSAHEDRIRNVYQRAGRTAPQNIEPSSAQSNLYNVTSEPEHTAFLDRPEPTPETHAPTATDLPAQPAPAAAPQQVTYQEPFNEPYQEPVAAVDTADTYAEDKPVDGRRGTMDFGLFLLRLTTGAILLFQGLRTFFELGGAPGLNGLKEQYASYAFGDILSIAVPSMQLAAGVFLLLGLLTPVAAAVATVVTAFNFLHEVASQDNFSIMNPNDSVILAAVLCALALSLQFTGPGRVSLDINRSWARRPLASSWILAVLGIAGAVALWWFGAGVNPFN